MARDELLGDGGRDEDPFGAPGGYHPEDPYRWTGTDPFSSEDSFSPEDSFSSEDPYSPADPHLPVGRYSPVDRYSKADRYSRADPYSRADRYAPADPCSPADSFLPADRGAADAAGDIRGPAAQPAAGAGRGVTPAGYADGADGMAARCRGVGKVYVTEDEEVGALVAVDKDFPPAKVSTIVGPSGSGKSSLLRILACVDRPTTGSVRIAGTEVASLGARGRRALRRTSVAYVFQNPMDNLVEYLDAFAQVKLAGRLRGTRPGAEEIDRLLRLLGLEHRADHRPAQLSGGEQQRLAFACAVVGRPTIVVADEPTAELDSASADRVLEAVHDLTGEGVAFILSSHDPRVMEAADHLLRLDHGRVVESW